MLRVGFPARIFRAALEEPAGAYTSSVVAAAADDEGARVTLDMAAEAPEMMHKAAEGADVEAGERSLLFWGRDIAECQGQHC